MKNILVLLMLTLLSLDGLYASILVCRVDIEALSKPETKDMLDSRVILVESNTPLICQDKKQTLAKLNHSKWKIEAIVKHNVRFPSPYQKRMTVEFPVFYMTK